MIIRTATLKNGRLRIVKWLWPSKALGFSVVVTLCPSFCFLEEDLPRTMGLFNLIVKNVFWGGGNFFLIA